MGGAVKQKIKRFNCRLDGYHRLFQRALVEAGLPWLKVNPCQARCFAQATGKLAKTARCDALMLARMGAVLDLKTRPPARRFRP